MPSTQSKSCETCVIREQCDAQTEYNCKRTDYHFYEADTQGAAMGTNSRIKFPEITPGSHQYKHGTAWFVCAVLIPREGGGYRRCIRTLGWDYSMLQWYCEGMIVTHWQPLFDLPPLEL